MIDFFTPRGVQDLRPGCSCSIKSCSYVDRTYSGGWIDVAAQRSVADETRRAWGWWWWSLELIRNTGTGQFARAVACLGWAGWSGLRAPPISEGPGGPRGTILFLASKQNHSSRPPSFRFSTSARGLAAPCGCFGYDGYHFGDLKIAKGPCWAMQAVHAGGSCSRAMELLRTFTGCTSHAHLQPSNSGHPMAFAIRRLEK